MPPATETLESQSPCMSVLFVRLGPTHRPLAGNTAGIVYKLADATSDSLYANIMSVQFIVGDSTKAVDRLTPDRPEPLSDEASSSNSTGTKFRLYCFETVRARAELLTMHR